VAEALVVKRDLLQHPNVVGILKVGVKIHQQVDGRRRRGLDLPQCLLRFAGMSLRGPLQVDALQAGGRRPRHRREACAQRQAGKQFPDRQFVTGLDGDQRYARAQQ
jgi:hypothetical protein